MTSKSDQFLATVAIDIVKLVCTVVGSSLVDHLGRRPLLFSSSFGLAVALFTIGTVRRANFLRPGLILSSSGRTTWTFVRIETLLGRCPSSTSTQECSSSPESASDTVVDDKLAVRLKALSAARWHQEKDAARGEKARRGTNLVKHAQLLVRARCEGGVAVQELGRRGRG